MKCPPFFCFDYENSYARETVVFTLAFWCQTAPERQRERDEAIRRGARLAAERERKKREQKEREERERQERLAEEQRKRDEQAKAKKHASMFDDLMAGAPAAF